MSLLELEVPTLQAGATSFSTVTFSNSSFSVLERIAISSSESSEPSFKFAIRVIDVFWALGINLGNFFIPSICKSSLLQCV